MNVRLKATSAPLFYVFFTGVRRKRFRPQKQLRADVEEQKEEGRVQQAAAEQSSTVLTQLGPKLDSRSDFGSLPGVDLSQT